MRRNIILFSTVILSICLSAFNSSEKKGPTVANNFRFNSVLIVLQENGGKLDVLPEGLSTEFKTFFATAVDQVSETFEDIKNDLQGNDKYRKVIHLTDVNCTRAKLLKNLTDETLAGSVIDLIVLGHGNFEKLSLHGDSLMGGENGSIRKLLTDARVSQGAKFNFNLNLVYMCNCVGSSVNDDWRAIGAKVSVGSKCLNFMPEPMTTLFIHKYLVENKTVAAASNESYNEARSAWTIFNNLFPPLGYDKSPASKFGCTAGEDKFETSLPIVSGDGTIKFNPLAASKTNPSLTLKFRAVGDLTGTTADDDLAEGTYYILNSASSTNKYLDVSGSCMNEPLCKVQLYDLGQSATNNKWVVRKIDGVLGGYTIKSFANNNYLDADLFNVFSNGCNINTAGRISSALPRTNQEWKIIARGSGRYTIKCIMSGRYLDAVNSCVNENRCKVQLWEDYSQASQKWKFVKVN